MIVAELLASFGIELENNSFLEANAALEVLKKGYESVMKVVEAGLEAVNQIGEVGLHAAEVQKVATVLGVTADELQRFQGAAVLADVGAEELTSSMRHLAIVTSEAAAGGKEALESLNGITFKDASGELSQVSDVALSAADKMSKMTSASEKLALAQKLFGRGAALPMVAFLGRGREAIEEDIAAYEKSGARLTKAQIEAGEKFESAKKRLGFSTTGILNTFASEKAIESLTKVYENFIALLQTDTVRTTLANISDVIRFTLNLISTILVNLTSVFEEHQTGIASVMDAVGYAIGYILGVWQGLADSTDEKIAQAKKAWQDFRDWIETPIDEGGIIGGIHLMLRMLPILRDIAVVMGKEIAREFGDIATAIAFVVDEIDGFLTIMGKLTGLHWEDAIKPALKATALSMIPGAGTIIGAGDAMKGWNASSDWLTGVSSNLLSAGQGPVFTPTNTVTVNVSQTNASPDDIATKVHEVLEAQNQSVMESIKGQR